MLDLLLAGVGKAAVVLAVEECGVLEHKNKRRGVRELFIGALKRTRKMGGLGTDGAHRNLEKRAAEMAAVAAPTRAARRRLG